MLLALLACTRPTLMVSPAPVDAAIVPGCPSEADGRLSRCQWRRVVWAHHLWASGLVERLIPSGNAVYNRYVEADAMAAGLEALGVPGDRILREPRALHTDENIAYALRIVEAERFDSLAVASDTIQVNGGCAMVVTWTDGVRCTPAPMDYRLVGVRIEGGVPDVRTEPVTDWLPLAQREAEIRAITGWKRPSSLWWYTVQTLRRPFGLAKPPPLPP